MGNGHCHRLCVIIIFVKFSAFPWDLLCVCIELNGAIVVNESDIRYIIHSIGHKYVLIDLEIIEMEMVLYGQNSSSQ